MDSATIIHSSDKVKEKYVEYVKKVYESMCKKLNTAFKVNNYYEALSDSLVELSTRGKELIILDISNGVKQINYKQIIVNINMKLKRHFHV